MQTLAIYRRLLSQGLIARDQAQRDQKETARVARCFFCSAWRSGSGWCSCCCPERRHLNRKSCRRSAPRTRGALGSGQRAEDGPRKLYKIITDKRAPDGSDKRAPDTADKRAPDSADKRA